MPASGFRFLHSGDFRLDELPQLPADFPPSRRADPLDAAATAAVRVFDLALARKVDFVVLTGDLLRVETAGRARTRRLLEQFERLDAAGITTYWLGGRLDPPTSWPEHWKLPPRVVRFTSPVPKEVVHERDGLPLARLWGCRWSRKRPWRPDDFRPRGKGPFRMALAYGRTSARRCLAQPIDYWALGGRETPLCIASETQAPQAVASRNGSDHAPAADDWTRGGWAGSPQARTPDELGPRGCRLVEVDAAGQVLSHFLETDALRFVEEPLLHGPARTPAEIETRLLGRLRELNAATTRTTCVRWRVAAELPLIRLLRHDRNEPRLLERLRQDFGKRSGGVWTLGLDYEPILEQAPRDEPSFWGEFVRRWDGLRQNLRRTLNFSGLLSAEGWRPAADVSVTEVAATNGHTPANGHADRLPPTGDMPGEDPSSVFDLRWESFRSVSAATADVFPGSDATGDDASDSDVVADGFGGADDDSGSGVAVGAEPSDRSFAREVRNRLGHAPDRAAQDRVLRRAVWNAWDRLHPEEPVGDPA